ALRGGADHGRSGGCRRAPAGGDRSAGAGGRRRRERRALALRADQALPSPPAGLHRRGGRGDADAEAEAPRRRGALRARDRGALLELEPAAADERRRVPAAERGDLDHVARVRRVDESTTADVDADVPEAVEEDEVSRLELAHRDRAAV